MTKPAKITLLLSLVIASTASAGLFKISDRQYTGTTDATIIAQIGAFLDRVEGEVNAKLPNADASNYLRGIADATVTSGSGIGADYASPFSLAIVGIQAGAGAKLGKGNSTKKLIKGDVKAENVQGVGAQGALMVGFNFGFLPNINIGFFDTERLKIFAHFFTYKHSVSEVNLKTTSFGFHGQYNLMRPRKFALGLFRWGGIDLTTGLHTTNLSAKISKSVKESRTESQTLGGVPISMTGTVEGTVNVGAKAKTYTIPVELSTSVRLAYLLGLFGGIGGDFSFGSAKADASVSAPFALSMSPATYGATGTAALDLGQKKGPHWGDFRYFVGPHVELGVLSIYAQYTQALISKTIGVNAGLKAFW